jgi:hypothetical protein
VSDDDDGSLAAVIREAVRAQIDKRDPPEVQATYERLVAQGYTDAGAVELIAAALMSDIAEVVQNEHRSRYIEMLARLPELPE